MTGVGDGDSGEQGGNRFSEIGHGHRARAVEQLMGRVNAEGRVDRCVEVRNGYGVLENLPAEIVGDPVGAAVLQSAPGQQQAEAGALVAASAPGVVGCRTSELRANGDEGLVEDALTLQVEDQGGQRKNLAFESLKEEACVRFLEQRLPRRRHATITR